MEERKRFEAIFKPVEKENPRMAAIFKQITEMSAEELFRPEPLNHMVREIFLMNPIVGDLARHWVQIRRRRLNFEATLMKQVHRLTREVVKFKLEVEEMKRQEENESDWEDEDSEEEEKKEFCMKSRTGMKYLSMRDVQNILMYAVSIQQFHDQSCTRFYNLTNTIKNGNVKFKNEVVGKGNINYQNYTQNLKHLIGDRTRWSSRLIK